MRLNPDCIRDILLDVEKKSIFGNVVEYFDDEDFENLKSYSVPEVIYHIRQCDHSGFFIGTTKYFGHHVVIKDLSPKGHEFIANIRKDTNWNKTKEIAQSVGSSSLDVMKDIAAQVISNLISAQFNK